MPDSRQAMNNDQKITALHGLLINNADFRRLHAYLHRFNPIKVMQASRSEIRNSSILSWLLNPHESHGLGADFLREFVAATLKIQNPLDALRALPADFSDAQVLSETNPDAGDKNRIDILIDCPSQNWLFIVENKIGASQSKNQLLKYYDATKKRLENQNRLDTKIYGVYLTVDGEDPAEEAKDLFTSLAHETYVDILSNLLILKKDSLSQKIVDFLEYFIEAIMEQSPSNLAPELEMRDIAKKLYREYREVIDFIVENGSQTALTEAFAGLSDNSSEGIDRFTVGSTTFELAKTSKNWISFVPVDWHAYLGRNSSKPETDSYRWHGCENWRVALPVGIWVDVRPKDNKHAVYTAIEVGPLLDERDRRSLIETIERVANQQGVKVRFTKSAKQAGAKYSRFQTASRTIEEADDVSTLQDKVKELVRHIEPTIPVVSQALLEWESYISKSPKN